jgi:hypothetical protein
MDAEMARSLYDRLLALSREAHAAGHHEVAYHVLTAALHAAGDALEEERAVAVADEAVAHLSFLDAHAAGHALASPGAASRPGRVNLYQMLATQATAKATLIRAQRAERARREQRRHALADSR